MKRPLIVLVYSLAIFPALAQISAPAADGDYVLINGKILTVDAHDTVAQAIAITGGKIAAVGSNADVRKAAAKGAHVIDLHGRAVTPGLIDAHCHFTEVDALYSVDLSDGINSIAEAMGKVKQRVATLKPGEWVRGGGWDEGKMQELRYIHAADIDQVAPDNPVWLTHTTGHYGVANSAALKLAGITRDTKDPNAGTIDRDAAGNPTGVLKESAMGLVTRRIPRYTHEQELEGLLRIIRDFNREGMTAAKYPSISQNQWNLLNEALKLGKLDVRVMAIWMGGRSLESARQTRDRLLAMPHAPDNIGDGRLISGGVKLYIDGSGGARTGWMYQDWNKDFKDIDKGNVGYPTTDPEVYRAQVKLLHEAGLHVSTHAIGDRAIDWVVDSYAAALKEKPTRGLRHGIIHCNTPTDHAIDEMARMQKEYDAGYPEPQAPFLWWIGDTYAGNLGPQRALRLEPFATYVKKGVIWAGGSDYNVTPFAARYGLWASVERKTMRGAYGSQPFGTAESVDVHTALRSYTIWAAHQLFLDQKTGSLEKGKEADLAIWDRNPYEIPADDLRNMKCDLTMLAGKVVYQADNSPVKVQ
ncbi:MAG TPA: amidohydrolase family protein [Bryobacteraceae bacterium]|nr:amidohydrolase family protein [Bryobacteraceae bacterium]